jgi:hypothetical protein
MSQTTATPPMPENILAPHRAVPVYILAAAGAIIGAGFSTISWTIGEEFAVTFAVMASLAVLFEIGALRIALADKASIAAGKMDPAGEKPVRIAQWVAVAGVVLHVGFLVGHAWFLMLRDVRWGGLFGG